MANFAVSVVKNEIRVNLGENTEAAAAFAAAADASADDAAQSAAYAGGFEVPEYASQSAGNAATTAGQIFRVPNGTSPQTFTWYRRLSSGSELVDPLATSAALAAPGGSALVGFIQSGTGAVTRTVQGKISEYPVSLTDYHTTGGSDYSPSLGMAIDAATNIFLPDVGATVAFQTNITRTLGEGECLEIDFNNRPTTGAGLIEIAGEIRVILALSSNAAVGATTLAFVDASAIETGDIINLQSTQIPSPNYALENKNETVVVKGRSGNTVTISRPLRFAWNTTDPGLSAQAYKGGTKLVIRNLNEFNPQVQGGTSPVIRFLIEGISEVVYERPRLTGLDDGFNPETNIFRQGGMHYYCASVIIRDGYYERMGYPFGAYACVEVLETASGRHNHHTSCDLGNWSGKYSGTVYDEGSFSAWSSHMCFFYEISGVAENQDVLPAIRSIGSKRSGIYATKDNTDSTSECDPGFLNSGFEYLYSGVDATQDFVDFKLRSPNRTGRSVILTGGRIATFSGFETDQREITVRSGVTRYEIGPGCNFGGSPTPQVWSALDPGSALVNVAVPPRLDATLSGGVYRIDPRQTLVDQSQLRLRCYGGVARRLNGASPITVQLHLNSFVGGNASFVVGKITLRATVMHQSQGLFSAIEQDYDFGAFLGGGAVLFFGTTPTSVRGPKSGTGGVDITMSLSSPTLVFTDLSSDNYLTFVLTLGTTGAPSSPLFGVEYELVYNEADRAL